MTVVDIGAGNRCFVNNCKGKFKDIYPYDVAGKSITTQTLYSTHWDLIILTDVLEHFKNMEDIFGIKWNYAFVSFPETPQIEKWEELKSWKHYKENEHLHCLNIDGIKKWFEEHNCTILGTSNFEDLIRTRWDQNKTNISSIMVKREK